MAESILQQQLKYFSDNQSGPRFTIIHGNRLKGYQFLNYQLSAVPEPGTMLLGGIAAACAVAGVWWKQRRAAAEAAATSA